MLDSMKQADRIISVRNLTKTFWINGKKTEVLKSVDLDVRIGEFVAIMGSSGSGKSTMLNILGCLDTFDEGLYELDGLDVSDLRSKELAYIRSRMLGFVFQSYNLLPRMTVLQNVMLPLKYSDISRSLWTARVEQVLEYAEIGEDLLFQEASKLSGGQKQRVAIARALVNDPLVVFADEPTGNLDSIASESILKAFESMNALGKTILMITHDLGVAKKANRIMTLSNGILEG